MNAELHFFLRTMGYIENYSCASLKRISRDMLFRRAGIQNNNNNDNDNDNDNDNTCTCHVGVLDGIKMAGSDVCSILYGSGDAAVGYVRVRSINRENRQQHQTGQRK